MRVPNTLLQEKELTLSTAFSVRQHDLCHLVATVSANWRTCCTPVCRLSAPQQASQSCRWTIGSCLRRRRRRCCDMSLSRGVGNHFAPSFVLRKPGSAVSVAIRLLVWKPSGQTAVPDSDHEEVANWDSPADNASPTRPPKPLAATPSSWHLCVCAAFVWSRVREEVAASLGLTLVKHTSSGRFHQTPSVALGSRLLPGTERVQVAERIVNSELRTISLAKSWNLDHLRWSESASAHTRHGGHSSAAQSSGKCPHPRKEQQHHGLVRTRPATLSNTDSGKPYIQGQRRSQCVELCAHHDACCAASISCPGLAVS